MKYLPTVPTVPTELLTKQDVARRQIETAISLLLSGGDMVSIHVLSSAAHDVIEGVAKQRGVLTPFEVGVLRYPDELQAAYRNTLKKPFNFMKHGGGPDELADFVPTVVGVHLVLSYSAYCHVYGEDISNGPQLLTWWKDFETLMEAVNPNDGSLGASDS